MATSPLIFYRLFTPLEVKHEGDFYTDKLTPSTTQLRIGPDNDGPLEKVFKLPLLTAAQADSILPTDENVTIVIRLGSAIIPEKRDPLYITVTDDRHAIGFKISDNGPIMGVEGETGNYLSNVEERGNAAETVSLTPRDWPDQFEITLKPQSYHAPWGSIFCAQGNGTKQCAGYSRAPRFRSNGMFLDIYRGEPTEEYIINYIEVKVFVNSTKA